MTDARGAAGDGATRGRPVPDQAAGSTTGNTTGNTAVLVTHGGTERRPGPRVLVAAMLADAAAVLVFVLVGQASHDSGNGVFATAWPFLVGVAGGWAGIALTRLAPLSVPAAAMMLVKTVIIGLVLRAAVQDGGVPLSFAVTTTLILGALFLGWRLAARAAGGPRRR